LRFLEKKRTRILNYNQHPHDLGHTEDMKAPMLSPQNIYIHVLAMKIIDQTVVSVLKKKKEKMFIQIIVPSM
jgi:hypothetical protein